MHVTVRVHMRHVLKTGIGYSDLSVYPRHSYKVRASSMSDVIIFISV